MPNILKCCIPGCPSTAVSTTMYVVPRDKSRLQLWNEVIYNKTKYHLKYNEDCKKISRESVCSLHFEAKYIKWDGKRKYNSVPTLFSEMEILKKIPEQPISVDWDTGHSKLSHEMVYTSTLKPALFIVDHDHSYDQTQKHKLIIEKYESTAQQCLRGRLSPLSRTMTARKATELVVPEAGPSTLVSTPHKTNRALQNHLNEENSDRDDGNEVRFDGVFDVEPEVTKSLEGPFTWQKKPYVFVDDTEKVSDDESSIDDKFPRNKSPLTEPRHISTDGPEPLTEHTDYVCNECNIPIYGARYTCVQCVDYDACVQCEARGAHAAHYVLRVPRGRPQDQVRRVIDAMKRCLEENEPEMMIPEIEEIKDEIKEDTSDVEECDPLYTFDDQQVPKPGNIDMSHEDRAQHAHSITNASSSTARQTVANVIRKTDSDILHKTDGDILHKTDSNISEQYVNDSYIISHSDANLTQPNNTYLLLDTNDINNLQEIDKNVVSCQTDNNVSAQTNTYFLYENVLYQTDPTLITQTATNEIDLTGTKEVDQFGANIIYENDFNKLHSLKTTNALPHVSQVISGSSYISNSSKPLNQKLVPVTKTHVHTSGNSRINPLSYQKRVITPVKRDLRGNLLLNKLP